MVRPDPRLGLRIYQVYQQAGFDKGAAKALVQSVIADSSAYEVPRR